MKSYKELNKSQQSHINGVISRYMDIYIRKNLVWHPEQMYREFVKHLKDNHSRGYFGIEGNDIYKDAQLWMVNVKNKDFILNRFNDKYERHVLLASKKSPLTNFVRFGTYWDKENHFKIRYGVDAKHQLIPARTLQNTNIVPWTVGHMETFLQREYNANLFEVLQRLSESPIEKKFFQYWYDNFGKKNKLTPCLIPQLCGEKFDFHMYRDARKENFSLDYVSCKKICSFDDKGALVWKSIDGKNIEDDIDTKINVRFDFAIFNVYNNKKVYIELDGHKDHHTVAQRNYDAVKRGLALKNNASFQVITGTRITRDIEGCFEDLREFLEYDNLNGYVVE